MAEMQDVEAATVDETLKKAETVKIVGPVALEHKPGPSEPATTAEEDRHTKMARQINLIWELSQAGIALGVVGANIAVAFVGEVSVSHGTMLANAFFLVIGFYFGRTNHARTGGVPPQ